MKQPLIMNAGLIEDVLKELYEKEPSLDGPTNADLAEAVTTWEGLEQDLKDWHEWLKSKKEPELEIEL